MAESPVTPTPDNPPMKRLRLTLTLDGHSSDDLANLLHSIADDIAIEGMRGHEERDVISSGGYHFTVVIRDATMTPERFSDELLAWADRQRDARRVSEGAS